MKLRIRENTIRLRLTQSEVLAVADRGAVEGSTDFGPATFVYALRADLPPGAPLLASLETHDEQGRTKVIMVIRAASDVVRAWARSDDEVGFEGSVRSLQVLVEKDFACLKPRRGGAGEDDDAFPNPNPTC
jgi:hypothetical protein